MARFSVVTLSAVLSLGVTAPAVLSQGTTESPDHPIVGAWMASTPGGPSMSVFDADGTVVMGLPASSDGPLGVVFVSSEVGAWEAIDEHAVHFTAVQLLSDERGQLVGSLTIEGYPVVSDDGATLFDDNTKGSLTIRNASGAILDVIAGGPPVTGNRMGVGAPGLPDVAAADASSEP
jgi:hypothetical protein